MNGDTHRPWYLATPTLAALIVAALIAIGLAASGFRPLRPEPMRYPVPQAAPTPSPSAAPAAPRTEARPAATPRPGRSAAPRTEARTVTEPDGHPYDPAEWDAYYDAVMAYQRSKGYVKCDDATMRRYEDANAKYERFSPQWEAAYNAAFRYGEQCRAAYRASHPYPKRPGS